MWWSWIAEVLPRPRNTAEPWLSLPTGRPCVSTYSSCSGDQRWTTRPGSSNARRSAAWMPSGVLARLISVCMPAILNCSRRCQTVARSSITGITTMAMQPPLKYANSPCDRYRKPGGGDVGHCRQRIQGIRPLVTEWRGAQSDQLAFEPKIKIRSAHTLRGGDGDSLSTRRFLPNPSHRGTGSGMITHKNHPEEREQVMGGCR
jgi:hypothetical protein